MGGLTFRVADAVRPLERFSRQRTWPWTARFLRIDRLSEEIGPGAAALALYPETAALLRGIRDGKADRRVLLTALKARTPAVAERFASLFEGDLDAERPLLELIEAAGRRLPSITDPVREVVLPAGHPDIPSEELAIPLGGFFVFRGPYWGQIDFDNWWDPDMFPFPLEVGFLDAAGARVVVPADLDEGIHRFIKSRTAPQRWEEAGRLGLENIVSPDGRRFSSLSTNGERRRLQSNIGYAASNGEFHHTLSLEYGADGQRRLQRLNLQTPPSAPGGERRSFFNLRRLSVQDDGGPPLDGPRLPAVFARYDLEHRWSQYFFMPGAVWRVTGYPMPARAFPIHSFAGMAVGCRTLLKTGTDSRRGHSSNRYVEGDATFEFQREDDTTVMVQVARSGDEEGMAENRVRFGSLADEPLPVDWSIESTLLTGRPPKLTYRVVSFPVRADTVDGVSALLHREFESARTLLPTLRQPSWRTR